MVSPATYALLAVFSLKQPAGIMLGYAPDNSGWGVAGNPAESSMQVRAPNRHTTTTPQTDAAAHSGSMNFRETTHDAPACCGMTGNSPDYHEYGHLVRALNELCADIFVPQPPWRHHESTQC